MNRRTVLAALGTAGLLGTGGCLNELGAATDGLVNTGGCPQEVNWNDEHTRPAADVDPDSIAGRFDCTDADRPQPSGDVCETFEIDGETYRTVDIEPYPDPPATLDESSVAEFVHDYERVHTRNRLLKTYGSDLVGGRIAIFEDDTVVSSSDGTMVAYVLAGYESKRAGPGGISTTDTAPYVAVYGVDETGVVRAETNDVDSLDEGATDSLPDPVEEGTLLECF